MQRIDILAEPSLKVVLDLVPNVVLCSVHIEILGSRQLAIVRDIEVGIRDNLAQCRRLREWWRGPLEYCNAD